MNNEYVRKIDELGRIVIPKELRNNLKIQDNENVLIIKKDDNICISKYSYLDNYSNFLKEFCMIFNKYYNYEFIIKDNSKVIYSNYKGIIDNCSEYPIIINSINIGSIIVYSNTKINIDTLKFIGNLLILYFSYIK